jgi:hypothetical protein
MQCVARMTFTHSKIVVVTALLAGCAGAPPPADRMASSEAAVRGANELGAANVPQAALHLKLAQEGIAEAKSLMSNGDNERASYVLMRAQSDAELAVALAKEDTARRQAEDAAAQARALSSQTQTPPSSM